MENVHNFEGNRSVRSLERDKMRIICIWTIRNYDTIFLYKMLVYVTTWRTRGGHVFMPML